MKKRFEDGVEDVQAAALEGRAVRDQGPYGVLIGDEYLHYTSVVIHEPVATGNQILEAAGKHPVRDYLLYRVLTDGLLEEIRPDEPTDLRHHGMEKFLAFRSDRSFRFELDDRAFDWGATRISGRTLKKLAEVDVATHDAFLVVEGSEDRLIWDTELFDLSAPGAECFVTRHIDVTIRVNTRLRQVHQRWLTFWEVVKLAYPEAVPSPTVRYTVTYSNGPHENPEGNMQDGQVVLIKNGMNFNVTPTDKS
jgi:Multiubiquitin